MPTSPANFVLHHLRHVVFPPDGGDRTDGELLDCFLARHEEPAFEALVRRHGRMVLGVCRRILRNGHDAEDAFQATFLVLVRKAAGLLSRQTVGDWLYGVAYHTALKARAAAIRREAMERRRREMPTPDQRDDVWEDLRPLLDQEIQRLPARYRLPVVLCDLEEKTRKEAALHLGWAEGTLSSRLARARVLLARRLARHGGAVLSGGAVALTLAQNTARACVPTSLAASTVKAATLVAAGHAATVGAISAPVAALTKGVLKAMFLTKLKTVLVFLLVLGFTGAGAGLLTHQVLAQKRVPEEGKEKPSFKGNPADPTEFTGLVLSVDAAKNTLTISSKQVGHQSFEVAKETKVFLEDGTGGRLGFKEGRLNDLTEGMSVTLRLSADRKTVAGIWAEATTVRGLLKALDAGKRTLTLQIHIQKGEPTEKTYEVSRDAVVVVHNGKAKDSPPMVFQLADLPVGAIVTLKLSADQKTAASVQAEGPDVRGIVKAVAGDKNTITVNVNDGQHEVEKTFNVLPHAFIEFGEGIRKGKGPSPERKLADVPVGANVTLKLSPDQKTVVSLSAEGAGFNGTVQAVDADKNIITLTIFTKKDAPGEGKTFDVAKDVVVWIDKKEAKLADLPVGAGASIKLSPDQKSVVTILADRPSLNGTVKGVDADKGAITVAYKESDQTFTVAKNSQIVIDGKEGRLADVPVGANISLKLSVDQKTVLSLSAEGARFSGSVKAVDAGKNSLTLTIFVNKGEPGEEKTFAVVKDVVVSIDGKNAKLAELPVEAVASIKLSPDQKSVINIQAEGPSVYGTVKGVDVDKGAVTLANKESDQTFAVVKNTQIVIDGKESRLADLPVEAIARGKLSADQKTILVLGAEGSTFKGLLKAIDVEKRTITVTVSVNKGETEDKVFEVAKDAVVATGINGVPLKLADLKGDKEVLVQMSANQKAVRRLTVLGE
jgi:RNA polymerase sigma factor (sigma-70 family)